MINFKIENHDLSDLEKFEKMKKIEWPDVEGDNKIGDLVVPPPIFAYSGIDNKLVGGLEFSSYHNPEGDGISVWINAVIVNKDFRKNGIASLLINKSVEVLKVNNHKVGYVFTNVPKLYSKCGWSVLKVEEDNHFVMKKEV